MECVGWKGEKERKRRRGRSGLTAHVRVSLKRRSREWRVETILDRSRASCRQISWRRVYRAAGHQSEEEVAGGRKQSLAARSGGDRNRKDVQVVSWIELNALGYVVSTGVMSMRGRVGLRII